MRGNHSLSAGGAFTHIGLHSYTQNVVPQITFGVNAGRPDDLLWAQAIQQMVKNSIGVSLAISAKDCEPVEVGYRLIRSPSTSTCPSSGTR